jgi:hypothetical protein
MFRVLAFLVLFLGLISTCYGEVIIGNWEGSSTDGWEAAVYTSTITPGCTEGTTLGNGSLKVANVANNFFCDVIVNSYGPELTTANWWSNDKFEIDIAVLAKDYTPTPGETPFLQFYVSIYATPLFGNGYATWTAFDVSFDTTQTLVVDYTSLKNDITANNSFLLEHMGIMIFHQSSGWAQDEDIYYLDNARLVPEPMTIVLLGLGGLTLIHRKK